MTEEARVCAACQQLLAATKFSKSDGRRRGKCRKCRGEHLHASYNRKRIKPRTPKLRAYELVHAKKRSKIVRAEYIRLKSRPCMDCGLTYPPYVMDFDHRPGCNKAFNVSSKVNAGITLERFMEEVAKCDLVCANCHRERTHGCARMAAQ